MECAVKLVGCAFYSAIALSDPLRAQRLAAPLGAIGTWQAFLDGSSKYFKEEATPIGDLARWLRGGHRREGWFAKAHVATAVPLAVYGKTVQSAGKGTALALIKSFVEIRNGRSHGIQTTPQEDIVAAEHWTAVSLFVENCPLFALHWWLDCGNGTFDLTGPDPIADLPLSTATARVLCGDARGVLTLIDVLQFDSVDQSFWLLNAQARNGRAQFLDYVSGSTDYRRIPWSEGDAVSWHQPVFSNEVRLPLERFRGRAKELRQAVRLLRDPSTRLLTITGFGGNGKTRLAQRLATEVRAHFRDGLAWIDLEGVPDSDELPNEIARCLRLSTSQLGPALQSCQALLILDNFEHLLSAKEVVVALLERCAELKVLITSRIGLQVAGEQQLPLDGLDCPTPAEPPHPDDLASYAGPSVLIDRIRDSSPTFQPKSADVESILQICNAVGGNPSALGLVAPWFRLSSADTVAADLARILAEAGHAHGPDRQRSIDATVQWSWSLLTSEERAVLHRLSLLPIGFTRATVQELLNTEGMLNQSPAPPPTLESVLLALVTKGLVERIDSDYYHMHPLISTFASRDLAGEGAAAVALLAWKTHWVAKLEAWANNRGLDPPGWHPTEFAYTAFIGRDPQVLGHEHDLALRAATAKARIDIATGGVEGVTKLDELIYEFSDVTPLVRARAVLVLVQGDDAWFTDTDEVDGAFETILKDLGPEAAWQAISDCLAALPEEACSPSSADYLPFDAYITAFITSEMPAEAVENEPRLWYWRYKLSKELQLGEPYCEAAIDFAYHLVHDCMLFDDCEARQQQAGQVFQEAYDWALSNSTDELRVRAKVGRVTVAILLDDPNYERLDDEIPLRPPPADTRHWFLTSDGKRWVVAFRAALRAALLKPRGVPPSARFRTALLDLAEYFRVDRSSQAAAMLGIWEQLVEKFNWQMSPTEKKRVADLDSQLKASIGVGACEMAKSEGTQANIGGAVRILGVDFELPGE